MVRHKQVIFFLALVLSCFARPVAAQETLRVAVSTYPLWLFTRNVVAGVEGVELVLALPASTGCPHDYALTPQDMQRLNNADVLILNGMDLDTVVLTALESLGRDIPIIDTSEGVGYVMDSEDGVNPHAYASPMCASEIVAAIASGLSMADPDHEEAYSQNAQVYSEALVELSAEISEWGTLPENSNVIIQHSALAYLADEAGMNIVAFIQEHEGQEPSATRMLQIGDLIQQAAEDEDPVAIILTEPQYPDRAAQTLAEEYTLPVLQLDSVATGPEDAPLDYYQQVMTRNLRLLQEALR